jgi:hypothetical protein
MVHCFNCNKKIACWYEIKNKPYCMTCHNTFFSFKITHSPTRKCSCCGYWKPFVYEDHSYKYNKKFAFYFCKKCAELLGFIPLVQINKFKTIK